MKRARTEASFSNVVALLAMLSLGGLLGIRVVRYLPFELEPWSDRLLGVLLNIASFLFILPLEFVIPHLLLLLAVVVLGVLLPRLYLESRTRPYRLRPWLHALIWVEFALNHYLFDINPYLLISMLVGWLALEWGGWIHVARAQPRILMAAAPIALVGLAVAADTWSDMISGLLMSAVLWVLLTRGHIWMGLRERRIVWFGSAVACQLLASALPLVIPLHGGLELGKGMAYSYCESPDGSRLFAAVPAALTMTSWAPGSKHGRNGYVAEYDARTLRERARRRFFSDEFYGRLEYLLCLPDSVQIGITNVTIDGREDQDHAMSFSLTDPVRVERDLLGGGVGHGIAYDETRDALFYVSEDSPVVVRVDRQTGTRTRMRVPPSGLRSLVVGPTSVHRRRDKLYLAEWTNGRRVHELDLVSLEVTRTFSYFNGGALGIAVDEDLDRLFTVGIWGMEVFDLRTGDLIARKRLGLLSRSPAIDPEHDLVFVPSTVEGKVRVFDRRTLELLGVLAVGHGPRIPYYSSAERRFYSGNSWAQFAWDAEWINSRFR